jgi:exonuclease III
MSVAGEGRGQPSPSLLFYLTFIFLAALNTLVTQASLLHNQSLGMSKLNLTFHAINCNSLNCSITSKKNQQLKIQGIVSLKSDIIFMSDLRLSNRNLVSCANDLEKVFRTNLHEGYEFFYNSTMNKRGVGILIKSTINFRILDRWDEPAENAILLKLDLGGELLTIGSIYGPNENCPSFFDSLSAKLDDWGNHNTVLAGDWNCLYSPDAIPYNIDCINMLHPPNPNNTLRLIDICERFQLSDPFRHLHPETLDYSYVPRDSRKRNRSRLDFFIVSNTLLPKTAKCHIEAGLQNCLFDHKSVFLKLGRSEPPGVKKQCIKNSILEIDTLQILVAATTAETYLQHTQEGQLPVDELGRRLTEVGLIKSECRPFSVPYKYWPDGTYSENDLLRRVLTFENLTNRITTLNIAGLEQLELSCDKMLFLEVLLNNLKNEIISFQAFFFKHKKNALNILKKDLEILKTNYEQNCDQIFEKEIVLNKILDEDAKRELEHFSMFEILNLEKMTPAFLNIAKQSKSSARLADIRKDNGEDFTSLAELKNYIRDYYANIYRVKPETTKNVEGCIENFLGPEILNLNIVKSKKISQAQKENLEADLSLRELDNAIEDMNPRTAGGPDGIGTAVLKKFWKVLRVPLYRYSSEMMTKGKLTDSFLVSSIKLIPKKGDTTKIKNWRPISLLNCIYKVVSKAVNNRLKKISDTILSRAQKGFANNRYIQECLININETISFCNRTNQPGMLVAIDQAKAFDTVNQDFVKEVYKFFGFGSRFMKMLEITTTGRKACILFDDNTSSEPVNLGTGFTQGNGPSPLQFNFCQEILIIKFEFDSRIKSIVWYNPRNLINEQVQMATPPRREQPQRAALPGPDPATAPEQPETHPPATDPDGNGGKVEGFADDTSVLAKAEQTALTAIKENLLDFEKFSGLKVNFDKCVILTMGCGGTVPDFISNSGFQVSDRITILGMEIFNNTELLNQNFNRTISQLICIRNFWTRFNLSMPGRITVAKTLMLSRLGYLGCIIDPDPEQLAEIEKIIYSFIKGKLVVAEKRIAADPATGGLGMINIADYLVALKCSWIVRARRNILDHWSFFLHRTGIADLEKFGEFQTSFDQYPIINAIVQAVRKVHKFNLHINNNILESGLLNNPVFFTGNRTGVLEPGMLAACGLANENPQHLKISSILNLGTMAIKPIEVLNQELNANFTAEVYHLLKNASKDIFKRKIIAPDPAIKPESFSNICNSVKKGSKKFRLILESYNKVPVTKPLNNNSLRKFCSLLGLPLNNLVPVRQLNTIWQCWGLANKIKEFSFKFFNNLLGINSRIGHFVINVHEGCTFCTLRNNLPVPRETFKHLFFDCPETEKTLSGFEAKYLEILDTLEKRLFFWFFGEVRGAPEFGNNVFLRLTMTIIQYYVWECKLNKRPQSVSSCLNFYFYHMDILKRSNGKLSAKMGKTNLDLCRYWKNERGRGW